MARLSSMLFIILFTFVSHMPSSDARNILRLSIRDVPTFEHSIVSRALPKGPIPLSSSGEKGHAMAFNEGLFAHFAKMDRILESVPSPGVGHRH
jgi:hypothetical protein|uniref:Inhibitor I9 domain-containing protein n=1 Tax=Fagus sylvatica TaxID=28930 RepID=A0A2N9F3V7_FAGSY